MTTYSKYTNNKDNRQYWSLQGYLGTDRTTGKRVRITRRKDADGQPFRTKRDAQREMKRLMDEFEQKGQRLRRGTVTFKEIFDVWITKVYAPTVKDNTLANTKRRAEMYVLPYFGERLIDKIDKRYCDDVAHEWADGDFKDVKRLIGLAERVFDYALYIGVINVSPMRQLYTPPQKKNGKKEVEFFERAELTHFLDVAYEHGHKWGALFHFMAYTGCRKGEAIALEWKDLNWKKKNVNIKKTSPN